MFKVITRVIAIAFLLIGITQNVSAHTMWMELGSASEDGNQQSVNVYFGEYSDAKPTSFARWFSNLKEVAVFLQKPNGEIVQLAADFPHEDHLTFQFEAKEDGLYKVYFEHEVKDIFKGMKITYSSAVLYGKNYKKQAHFGFYGIELLWKKLGGPAFNYRVNQSPVSDATVTAAKLGDKTADLNLISDQKGNMHFPKKTKGSYLLEVVEKNDVVDQTYPNQAYKVDYKMFTYQINLK